jgi:hypothetical protein
MRDVNRLGLRGAREGLRRAAILKKYALAHRSQNGARVRRILLTGLPIVRCRAAPAQGCAVPPILVIVATRRIAVIGMLASGTSRERRLMISASGRESACYQPLIEIAGVLFRTPLNIWL